MAADRGVDDALRSFPKFEEISITSLSYGTRPKHKLVDARVRVPCGRLGLSMNERHEVRYI
jgi:hypothetical protein